MSEPLVLRRCRPCEGGVEPLSAADAAALMQELDPAWTLAAEGRSIERRVAFPGFARPLGFLNAVAWIAQVEGHHPDLELGYGYCHVRYTTHAIGGLSENDFICAAKVDRLLDDTG